MIEKICSLDLQGEFFENEEKLNLFGSSVNRSALIFGKNGCGKSTIARAIYCLSLEPTTSSFLIDRFLDEEGNSISLSDEDKKHIYVFNEAFIDQNLKLTPEKDGMHAIVLFGKAGNLEGEISTLETEVDSEKAKKEKRDIGQFHDPQNLNSLDRQKEGIKKALQNGWALREQKIKNGLKRSQVNDAFLDEMINFKKPASSVQQLSKDFDELLSVVASVDSTKTPLPSVDCLVTKNTDDHLAQILNRSFELESQNELVLAILNSINKYGSSYVEFAHYNLSNESVCPVCFQPISEEYKKNLFLAIEQVLDDRISKEKAALLSEKMDILNPDLSIYYGLISNEKLIQAQDAIKVYNDVLVKDNELIDKKVNNIRKSLNVSISGLDLAKKSISEVLVLINSEIKKYNDTIANYEKAVARLNLLNKEISFFDVEPQIAAYRAGLAAETNAISDNTKSDEIIKNKTDQIFQLNQEQKSFSIALDEINGELACIFSSKKRLFLSDGPDPAKYYINSNGHKISLDKLSVGERNIIALCYFFENIKQNCKEGDYFKSDSVVVLDDPISSFDFENKLGIYSYLKGVLSEVLGNNKRSKVLVLSHELDVIISMDKVIGDINCGPREDRRLALGHQIDKLDTVKFSNYSALLFDTFNFADSLTDGLENVAIGNTIRRALEAYANFNYRCSMDFFLSSSQYSEKIKDESLRAYFQKRMYRLVLNSASHTQDLAHQLPDIDQFDQFSVEEQKQTAKEVLVFLYCIDPLHIERHFLDNSEKINKIISWKNEILSNIRSN